MLGWIGKAFFKAPRSETTRIGWADLPAFGQPARGIRYSFRHITEQCVRFLNPTIDKKFSTKVVEPCQAEQRSAAVAAKHARLAEPQRRWPMTSNRAARTARAQIADA
jgi:hypothetical protein